METAIILAALAGAFYFGTWWENKYNDNKSKDIQVEQKIQKEEVKKKDKKTYNNYSDY